MSDVYGAQPPAQIPEEPAQSQVNDVAGAWRAWLTNPENRASMMQFGINMLQPIGVGQSQAGHFGSALGAAGEASDRVRDRDLARRKAEAEIQYKEERGNLAAERAYVAQGNLQLQQELLEMRRMLGSSQRAAELEKRYSDAKLLDPTLKLEDFLKRNQQFIRAIQAQEGRAQGGSLPNAGVTGGATRAPPQVGEIRDVTDKQGRPRRFRFKGGDPNKQESWEELG